MSLSQSKEELRDRWQSNKVDYSTLTIVEAANLIRLLVEDHNLCGSAHEHADDIVVALLRNIGASVVADAWESIDPKYWE